MIGLGLVLVEFEYEYQGRDGVLVSIKPNERYVLLAKTNDHWWQVQSDCSSKPFYIPAKYVKELPADFPSPLDFADPLSPEPVLVPMTAPAPVTIRLRPDTSTGYRKTENRLSTFGVPLDFHDLSHQVVPAPRHPGNPPSGLIETGTSRNTNMANGGLSQKQPHLPGCLDDQMDSGKARVPSFSPADPLSTARLPTQPIPVETPVVPVVPPNNGIHNRSSLTESADEDEDSTKEEESNHIYESIQDLNLDLEALVGGRVSPGEPPESVPAPAPPPTKVRWWRQWSDLQLVQVLDSLHKEVSDHRSGTSGLTVAHFNFNSQEVLNNKSVSFYCPLVCPEEEHTHTHTHTPTHTHTHTHTHIHHSHVDTGVTFQKRPVRLYLSVCPQHHLLEKAGIINKTKVADNGKKIRKNWSQSWTVLHGGILTFHKDPKSAPTGNASKASQIVPEYTVDLRGSSISWASKDKSSKKNVLELRTRHGCEYLMQYDTESIISDWLKVIQDTIRQLEQEHLTEDEDEAASDKEDKDRKRTSTRTSSGPDSEQRRVRTKLRRFLQRRPTLQSVKEKGYIRDNVFGCHLDTLCHRENTTIPRFVEKCVRAVERRGLDVDGIYRVSGNLAVIQRLRHKADHEEHLDLEDGQWEEIHVITGALKLFLRELPEPLFPFSCFDKFIAAIQVPDYSMRVSYMKDLVRTLPLPNHDTMELLFKHLRRVIEHKDSNRMSVQSVAIVFGPTLLRPQTESANMTIHMVFQSQIVELMLNEFQTVFSQS
uniref:Rho GTPase activating protein 27, like n=1 Tax=Seriola lalandi dorsalis TaxID=1841481 RepID=A0A3B4WQX0_SERLL